MAMSIESLRVIRSEPDSLVLDCETDVDLPDSIREALEKGVGIEFVMEIRLRDKIKYWPNPEIGDLKYVFQVKYHALSKQYIVTSNRGKLRAAYPDLYSAFRGKSHIAPLRLILSEPLAPDKTYYLEAVFRMRTETLPLPLRMKSYFYKEWRPSSGWTTWPI
jgi:hypothetical protein